MILGELHVSMYHSQRKNFELYYIIVQGGSNMTGTDLCVNKPHSVLVIFEPPCTSTFFLLLVNQDLNQSAVLELCTNVIILGGREKKSHMTYRK